jgi:hypothetical protein
MTERMCVKLTTWERVTLLEILGDTRGDLATLRTAGRAMDALELTQAEKDAVAFQTVVTPQGAVQYQWLNTDHVFEVEIADPEAVALLRQAVTNYQGWRAADLKAVESLMETLGVS